MKLITESYLTQKARWPQSGRHILAQFDAETVVVYQAYRLDIGRFAVEHGYFGGAFSLTRMSWIKTNFLWMMYRCGWATKPDQEVVLAVSLHREAFESVLAAGVHSKYVPDLYREALAWKQALRTSNVRLQWDPDHSPVGGPMERRAIQLGLRGDALTRYAKEWIVCIEDITPFVHMQYDNLRSGDLSLLETPREEAYPLPPALVRRLGTRPNGHTDTEH